MSMKTRHTHKTDWIQRTSAPSKAVASESVMNQVRDVKEQPRKWPVIPKAHSEEEEELKRYKCPKTKRAHRKAYRQKHRDVKSDSEASEECDDMTIDPTPSNSRSSKSSEQSQQATAKYILSSAEDDNEDENLPPVEPSPHIPPPLPNEDNFKVNAKPFVPSGLPFTQIIRNAKKYQDGEAAYYMQPHVPSLNYVPHVIPPPHAPMHPVNHHVQPHHHQQHAHAHQQHAHQQHAIMYKNPNEYRGWAGKKEIDQSQYELDLAKILSGENTLTALMVKNIPNRYTQDMILETIGERHAGLYDFFYLPIDFKNKCNVGYFFINFIDPMSIPNFYMEFNQKRWAKFNSSKVCKITYARIQGKSAFIEHFRNSSLLTEDLKCQPLIFYSYGPQQGLPEPFPDPRVVHPRIAKGSKTQQ